MSAAPRRKKAAQAPVPEPETIGLPEPYTLAESGASVSLGFDDVPGVGMMIFPWIAVSFTQMKGGDLLIDIGEFQAFVKFDFTKIEEQKWEVSKVIDGVHSQKLAWLRHQPAQGISVRVEQKADEDGG